MHTYTHAHTDISNIHTIQTLTYTRKYAHAVTSIPPHTHTCSSSTSRVLHKYNISSAIAPPLSVRYFTPHLPSRPSDINTRGNTLASHCFFFKNVHEPLSVSAPLPQLSSRRRGRAGREGGRGVQRKITPQSQLQRIPAPQTCPPRNQRGEEAVQPRPSGRLQAAVPGWLGGARQQHW